jgi:capsular polysaccharide transport system ATP-binding protein
MAIDFDIYLVDEITAVGDSRFQKKCRRAFEERRDHATIIIVSHDMATIRSYCDTCAVLHNGRMCFFENLDEAQRVYEDQ